jgi:hypothetical protein
MAIFQAYSPAGVIFTGIASLLSVGSAPILFVLLFDAQILQAVLAVNASQSVLVDVFERIENFFIRLGTYIELPPTAEMTDIIVKVMVDVLLILALVTREIRQGKISELILDDISSSFDLPSFRKISEKAGGKVGYRGCLAKARQANTRRKSDGGCARSEGHARRG